MSDPVEPIHVCTSGFGNAHPRRRIDVSEGKTIAEIISVAFPGYSGDALKRVRVTLLRSERFVVIEHDRWERVRPKVGTAVILNVVPGKGALKSILQIVVSIAAVALGAYFGPMLFGAGLAGQIASAGITLGALSYGHLRCNGLMPYAPSVSAGV